MIPCQIPVWTLGGPLHNISITSIQRKHVGKMERFFKPEPDLGVDSLFPITVNPDDLFLEAEVSPPRKK